MKSIDLNLNYFNKALGLSCVENLVMYILEANGIPYRWIYYDSFLTIDQIEKSLTKVNSYADFCGIRRIQDIAMEEGIINMDLIDAERFPTVDKNCYCCVMVKPEFIKSNFGLTLWRNDHYVLLSPINIDNFYYINNTPRHIAQISRTEIERFYFGKALGICILNTNNPNIISGYFEKFVTKLPRKDLKNKIQTQDILVLRDIIGILKIIRRRTVSFVSLNNEIKAENYFKFLDRCYAQLEYMRLKKQVSDERLENIKIEICNMDFEFIKNVNSVFRI